MKRTLTICGTILLAACVSFAQEKPAAGPHDMEHMHHGGFMQGGMHHASRKGVKLDAKVDAAAQYGHTPRGADEFAGAHFAHEKCRSRRICCGTFRSMAGCSRIIRSWWNASGNAVPGTVLHHVAFWNENRADFLCPNKEEHIFGAGSEMTDWPKCLATAYRVEKGNRFASRR